MVITLLPDLPEALRSKVQDLLRAAYTPGTWGNKMKQMRVYAEFVRTYKLNDTTPSRYQIMAYIAFLYHKYHVPGTVFNYLSGAKSWVSFKGGNVTAFDDYLVLLTKKGVAKSAVHSVRQVPPLFIADIKKIVDIFDKSGTNAHVFKTVTLIAYFTMLRQGNLVRPTVAGSSSHVVRQHDINVVSTKMYITVRSSKTMWKPADQYTICIPCIPNSEYCPVRAWKKYYKSAPKGDDLPAFWVNAVTPVCAVKWVGAIRYALGKLKYPTPEAYTLHSLRRGAATSCILEGMEPSEVREAGRWKSGALYDYIPKKSVKAVPAALATFFG